jgi:hypothetical protein
MKPVYILMITLGSMLLALIYQSEWLSRFYIIGAILAVALRLANLNVVHVVRSNSSTVYTKRTREHEAIHWYLTVSIHFFD